MKQLFKAVDEKGNDIFVFAKNKQQVKISYNFPVITKVKFVDLTKKSYTIHKK